MLLRGKLMLMHGQCFLEEKDFEPDPAETQPPLRAGSDFFAPAPPDNLDKAIARIHQRAELVTPLLDEILHNHRSFRRDQYTQAQ